MHGGYLVHSRQTGRSVKAEGAPPGGVSRTSLSRSAVGDEKDYTLTPRMTLTYKHGSAGVNRLEVGDHH